MRERPHRESALPGRDRRSLVDWCLRARDTDRIAIIQFPNIRLWVFFTTVALRVVTSGSPRTALDWIGAIALGTWAMDEVIRGVNPWRRLLGVTGCVFAVKSVVSLL